MNSVRRFSNPDIVQVDPTAVDRVDQDRYASLSDLMQLKAEDGSKEVSNECFRPTSNLACGAHEVRALGEILRGNFADLVSQTPHKRDLLVEMDEVSRSGLCIALVYLLNKHYFKTIKFKYTEFSYQVGGEDLKQQLATEAFWSEVFNYPSKLMALPLLPGRYDASINKSVFVSGGLDFARVTHLAARWEPNEVVLTKASAKLSDRDEELISSFDGVVSQAISIERLDIAGLLQALDAWSESLNGKKIQPLLICGGWKLHAVTACMWAIERGWVPTFVCLPDFISSEITSIPGQKWDITIRDAAVLV